MARLPSAQVSTVEHCACIGPPALHPTSASFISIRSVHPCLLRTGQMGWRGGGGAEPTLSRLRVPMKGVSEWRTSLEIVYAAWHVRSLCGNVMYVCHSIRWTAAVDIKAHTLLIRFVVDLLYNKLWTCCRGCCRYVVDLLFVCYTWPSFCTKWRAQKIWVTLLACSSVYVASAAIGLVLGLVLGLKLGLGRVYRKLGSIAALYAGSFIPLRFHFLGAQLHIWY